MAAGVTEASPPMASYPWLHPTVREYVRNPRIAAGYDTCFAGNPLFGYDCLFLSEHLRPPGVVLDAGCGTGRHLAYLAARGFTTVGLDLSVHMLNRARANLAAGGQRQRLVRADLHALPISPHAGLDGVLLMFSTLGMVMGHARRVALLRSLAACLDTDGRLLAHFHNLHYNRRACRGRGLLQSVRTGLERLRTGTEPGDMVMPGYRGLQDLYLHCFTTREIEELFGAAGLRILELRGLNKERNGPCREPDWERTANGFLVAAHPA